MKRQELKLLRNKSLGELRRELRDNRERLNTLRFDLAMGKVDNASEIRSSRKSIAQFITVIKEKEFKELNHETA